MQRTIGRTVLHRQRFGRVIGLGDRASPVCRTPALVRLNGDPDGPCSTFPLTFSRDPSTTPAILTMRATAPELAYPVADGLLTMTAEEGLHLPSTLAEADSGTRVTAGRLLALSWQSLHHDEALADASLSPAVVMLIDAPQLAGRPGLLVEALDAIRHRFPAALLWAPGIGGPDNCAVLTWFGVDLFDLGRVRQAAAMHVRSTVLGPRRVDSAGGESDSPDDLLTAGLSEWTAALSAVRRAIEDGDLRGLVEQQALSSSRSVEHLRRHDAMQRQRLQVSTDTSSSSAGGGMVGLARVVPSGRRLRCHSEASHDDAIIVDWIDRIVDAHEPPDRHRDTLLLLPCSQRKPYFLSQSHRALARVIPADSVDEVSVTSPLGIVPRAMEDLWPAAHYDIPVTGDWNLKEREVIGSLIECLVDRFGYARIVDHSGICRHLSIDTPTLDTRLGDGTTSRAAMDRLAAALEHRSDGSGVAGPRRRREILLERFRAISRFLHGSDAWLDGTVVGGKPPRWLIRADGQQLAQWHPQAGRFAFAKASLQRLHDASVLPVVDISDSGEWKGDLFTTNVEKWDPTIRIGDELLVVRSGTLIGSARATAAAWEWSGSPGRLARSQHRL